MNQPDIHITEILTIVSLVSICILSMFLLDKEVSKDVSISVTSGLLGYLTKTITSYKKDDTV